MQPSLGRIVLYRLHAQDAEQINRRRNDFSATTIATLGQVTWPGGPGRSGHIGHYGSTVSEGDVFAAVIVRTFESAPVNLKVLLDGNDDYWATSRLEGDEPGQWFWPPRV